MTSTERFYCLGSPLRLRPDLSTHSVYGTIEWYRKYKDPEVQGVTFEPIVCGLDPRHRRGGRRFGNIQLVLPTTQPSDFIWTWMGPVVTDSVLQLFQDSGFSGIIPRPAAIIRMNGRKSSPHVSLPKVWELEIAGRGVDANPESGIRLLYTCPECGYSRYSSFQEGIIIDPKKWDGSDFFTVTGYPNIVLVTERVIELIIKHKLTNCAIIKSEDLRWGDMPRPEDNPENFVPGKVAVKPLQRPAP